MATGKRTAKGNSAAKTTAKKSVKGNAKTAKTAKTAKSAAKKAGQGTSTSRAQSAAGQALSPSALGRSKKSPLPTKTPGKTTPTEVRARKRRDDSLETSDAVSLAATTTLASTAVADRVTRFAADLVEAAAQEGVRQSRSARQQLDYWVRLGRAVSTFSSTKLSRIESALDGRLPLSDLTAEEGVVFNAQVETAIEDNLRSVHYGQVLGRAGVPLVALNEAGELTRYGSDGTTTPFAFV